MIKIVPLNTIHGVTTRIRFLDDSTLIFGRASELVALEFPSGRGHRIASGFRQRIVDIDVTANGTQIGALFGEGRVSLWNGSNVRVPHHLALHAKSLAILTLSPDGRHLAAAPADKPIAVFDTRSGNLLFASRWGDRGVFTPDGRTFVAGGAYRLSTWDVSARRIRREIPTGDAQMLRQFAVSPDGRRVYVLNEQGKPYNYSVQAFHISDLSVAREFNVASGDTSFGSLRGAALSADGRYLVTLRQGGYPVSETSPFAIWNAETGANLLEGTGPEWDEVALSHTGRWIALRRGSAVSIFAMVAT